MRHKTLRIAQVAPLFESVPPHTYGGTERIVSYLTEELISLGHQVTLFAAGDSVTKARLVPISHRSLRRHAETTDPLIYNTILIDKVLTQGSQFDLIHFHCDYFHFPASRYAALPNVTTLHGRLDLPELGVLFEHFDEMPLVSISQSQRRPLRHANWVGNVYHGLPDQLLKLHEEEGRYLAFLGRICPEKRVDRAIRIALRAGIPLKIAAKVDKADRGYFETEIKHLLSQPGIEYVGEITQKEKEEFLGNALAYLFPIDWPEPFGLTMIESMACGTPTVAFRGGAVPEILQPGVTGYIVNNEDEAVDAVALCKMIDRVGCRNMFLKRFTSARMTEEYLAIYNRLVQNDRPRRTSALTEAGLSLVP
jgi:glycosyltransferase involved in cell wall biosynthesis